MRVQVIMGQGRSPEIFQKLTLVDPMNAFFLPQFLLIPYFSEYKHKMVVREAISGGRGANEAKLKIFIFFFGRGSGCVFAHTHTYT